MSDAKDVIFNLKAVINKQKNRVLFAEVDNDFVNLLFSFLILPLGVIMQILDKHYGDKTPHVIGSFNTLYNGLANLGGCSFQLRVWKPKIFHTDLMAYAFPHLNMDFSYSSYYDLGIAYFGVYKVFTKDKASFIICDDLRIVPNAKGSILQTLNNVGVDMVDMDGSETRNVTFEPNQVMDFLKVLLISRQPLTDFILGAPVKSELQICKSGIQLHQKEATADSKKMILKAMFRKSTKKFLVAQAGEDFVSFILKMLEIPLGMVDLHLGGDTYFNNLGNLYKSIADLVDNEHLQRRITKEHLLKPETFSSSQLSEVAAKVLNVDRSRMYMVTDDLTVAPLYVTFVFSLLDQMNISSSDVEEVELHIGLEEARNILKASLTSTRAFSDGLTSPLSKKQLKPKQEG